MAALPQHSAERLCLSVALAINSARLRLANSEAEPRSNLRGDLTERRSLSALIRRQSRKIKFLFLRALRLILLTAHCLLLLLCQLLQHLFLRLLDRHTVMLAIL